MFIAVRRAHAAGQDEIDAGLRELLSVDSTVVRAHQHAAGARRDSADTGAGTNDKNVVPGEPADHAIGRCRGGLTTKIHALPDQKQRRKDKGSAGSRLPAFDVGTYKKRNTVERGFNRLKQWRAIATRYDKYAVTYLGGVTLAATITVRLSQALAGQGVTPRTSARPP